MMKALRALLGKTPRDDSAKKAVPDTKTRPSKAGGDYRAVSIALGVKCCLAAKDIVGKRYLLRDGLRLPLPDCTMPTNCSCKFKKDLDRRDGDRRQIGATETNRWFAGPEHRKRGGRRSVKD